MRRAVVAVLAVGVAAALAGCAPTVALKPAPRATSAACAGVIVRVASETLGTLAPRQVNAQGTAAWGDPLAVTLYCGVPLHPTADQCGTFDGVDWKDHDTKQNGTTYEVLTTVGRTPIVQFWVDPSRGVSANDPSVLQPISDAVRAATEKTGLGCTTPSEPAPSATS